MRIHRRQFLKHCIGSTATMGLPLTVPGKLEHPLAVEGGIPTAFGGNTCLLWTDGDREVTALEALEMLARKWKSGTSWCIGAEGKEVAGQIVTICDGYSATQSGAVSVNSSGNWTFRQENPSPIPHRLKAESDSRIVFNDVVNVPVTGDDKFELKNAEWHAEKREFKIQGEGTAGAVVEIYNPRSKNKIGKVPVDSDGKWQLLIKKPVTVACAVRAVCNGQRASQNVKSAPGNCV